MKKIAAILFLGALAFVLPLFSKAQSKPVRPNIIFIVIDDLGPAWLPPYAKALKAGDMEEAIVQQYKMQQKIKGEFNIENQLRAARTCMPFLDKLSATGVKFNRCFTTSSLCAPSRSGMITAKYSQSWGAYTIPESESVGIPANILMLPLKFQQSGYNTGVVGKWHLSPHDEKLKKSGDLAHYQTSCAPGQNPLDRGFNYYYGYNAANSTYYAADDLWEGRSPLPPFTDKDFLTDIFNAKAKEFVQSSVNKKMPFFLYYAPMTLHGNITPCPKKYSEKFKSGIPFTDIYAGHLLALDEGIKEIYNVLEKAGQANNTLFILCSDNGPAYAIPPYAAPYKGGKGTGWLGGSHSPLIMAMPGKIKPAFNNDLVSCLDILPTALDVAGLSVPQSLDGVSLKKMIFEGKQDKPHQTIFSSGLHSSRWSYSYYNGALKKIMDNDDCPVYVWGLDDANFSLHLTEVKPGIYEGLPKGQAAQNLMFNYVKDPLCETELSIENTKQKKLDAQTKEWLKRQKDPLRDRKKEHGQLIEQIR